jgi:hypothetical protein
MQYSGLDVTASKVATMESGIDWLNSTLRSHSVLVGQSDSKAQRIASYEL